jgi:hypothetical protein
MTAAEEAAVPPAGTARPGEPAGGGSVTTAHAGQVTVSAELKQGYQFLVDFGTAGTPSLLMDEPEPLGEGQGPNASRLLAIKVRIHPDVEQADSGRAARCLELFEDFCIVTQSVRSGLDVSVEVQPADHG